MAATNPEILLDQGPSARNRRSAHVAALTGYRGIAALVVLVVHASGQSAYPDIGLDGYGPIALFVLSGYLLIAPWSKWSLGLAQPPDLPEFARRRIARIFPAYLLVLGVVALIHPPSRPQDAASWLRALTLTNFLEPDGLRPWMQHIWTMGVELSWYVALPVVGTLLALAGRRLWVRSALWPMALVTLGSAAVTVAWQLWLRGHDSLDAQLTYPLWLPGFLICFTLGASVRHLEIAATSRPEASRWLERLGRHSWVFALLAAAAVAVLLSEYAGPSGYVPLTEEQRTTRHLAALALALALLILAVARTHGVVARAMSIPAIVAFGRWSYGVYLWHLPVTVLLASNMGVPAGPAGFILWIVIVLGVSVALAAATYRFVEEPIMAWSKRGR